MASHPPSKTAEREYTNRSIEAGNHLVSDDKRIEEALARISAILQKAFVSFRENIYVDNIVRVEENEDEIRAYDGVQDWEFRPPQNHLVQKASTKQILLLTGMCTDAAACTHNLLMKLVAGLDITIQEIRVRFFRTRLSVKTTSVDGREMSNCAYPHETLLITANESKQQWIIDLTGLQYGIQKSFWKWSEYREHNFVDSVVDANKNGWAKEIIADLAKKPGVYHLTHNIPAEIAEQFDVASGKWASDNMALAKLPLLGHEFQRNAIALQVAMSGAVREYIRTHDFTPRINAAQLVMKLERNCDSTCSSEKVECLAAIQDIHARLATDERISEIHEEQIKGHMEGGIWRRAWVCFWNTSQLVPESLRRSCRSSSKTKLWDSAQVCWQFCLYNRLIQELRNVFFA